MLKMAPTTLFQIIFENVLCDQTTMQKLKAGPEGGDNAGMNKNYFFTQHADCMCMLHPLFPVFSVFSRQCCIFINSIFLVVSSVSARRIAFSWNGVMFASIFLEMHFI